MSTSASKAKPRSAIFPATHKLFPQDFSHHGTGASRFVLADVDIGAPREEFRHLPGSGGLSHLPAA